jgi:hypothetical protein
MEQTGKLAKVGQEIGKGPTPLLAFIPPLAMAGAVDRDPLVRLAPRVIDTDIEALALV